MSLRVVTLCAALVLAVGAAVLAYIATIHPTQVGAKLGFIVLALGSVAAWTAFVGALVNSATRRRQVRLETKVEHLRFEVLQLRDEQAMAEYALVMDSRGPRRRHLRSIAGD